MVTNYSYINIFPLMIKIDLYTHNMTYFEFHYFTWQCQTLTLFRAILISILWLLKQSKCNFTTEKLLPIPYWKGFIRSMGKYYTYQDTYIPQIAQVHVMYTGAKVGEWDEMAPLEGKDDTYHMMKIVYVIPMCAMGAGLLRRVVPMGYLRWSDGVSWTTSSHILHQVLLWDGSLMQIRMASLMVLVKPCAFLPTLEKQSTLMECPVVWLFWLKGEGVLRCSLSLSLKVFPDSLIYSSLQSAWMYLNQYIIPLFWVMVSFSFWASNRWQMVLLLIKCTSIPR